MSNSNPDPFPDVIRIETVGLCNFNCVHCPTGIDPNGRRVLKPEQFNAILDQLRAANFVPRVVVLYHGGEPLLNKNIGKFIKALKDFGVKKTVITTNASLLTEDLARDLILSGLDEMKVSFDGESAEENDEIRVNGNFQEDAGKVLAFLRIRKQTGRKNPQVIISNIRISDEKTVRDLPDEAERAFDGPPVYIREFFKSFSDEIIFRSFPAMVWPGYNKLGDMKEVNLPSKNPDYCGSLFETTTIMSNGNVVPCCYDLPGEAVFGNVSEKSPLEIWNGPEYTSFRNNFRNKKYPAVCKKCNFVRPRYLCKT